MYCNVVISGCASTPGRVMSRRAARHGGCHCDDTTDSSPRAPAAARPRRESAATLANLALAHDRIVEVVGITLRCIALHYTTFSYRTINDLASFDCIALYHAILYYANLMLCYVRLYYITAYCTTLHRRIVYYARLYYARSRPFEAICRVASG